jgi:ParB-like chromosome segregation protein Spo0J
MTSPTLTIPITAVIEGDRARNAKKYGNIEGLAASIASVGLIQPIVLSLRPRPLLDQEPKVPYENLYDLVAGGRRFRALMSLGVTELHHGVTLRPGTYGFIFESEVPQHARLEAELDENLHRLDMDWIDNCLLIDQVHTAKRLAEGHKWGQRQTAELLGPGYSKSNVNYALRVAKLLRKQDKDILACSTMMDAIAVMVKRKEDEALDLLRQRATPTTFTVLSGAVAGTASFLDSFNMSLGEDVEHSTTIQPPSQALAMLGATAPALISAPVSTAPAVAIPLSTMFRNGSMLDLPWPQVSHVITDIPFGIDMENLNKKQVVDVVAEHEVEANVNLMQPFLQRAYDAVLPHGFCVFFYDLDHHEKLQAWARDIGWKVQRWPLIWSKTHTCQNNAAQFNTTKNFEVAMILRKDEHTVLRKQQPTSVWTGDGAAERNLYNNPFAKPFELWKWIYDMVAFPGQTVLDPFCGEMSACRAAANCGLVPYGIEINPKHYNRGIEHMKAVYALIHKSNVVFQ